jgi:hypothetical protein
VVVVARLATPEVLDRMDLLMTVQTEPEDYPIMKCPVKIYMFSVGVACYYFEITSGIMALKYIAATLFGIWIVLVLAGKGGFVHLLLLNAIGLAVVYLMGRYRARMAA